MSAFELASELLSLVDDGYEVTFRPHDIGLSGVNVRVVYRDAQGKLLTTTRVVTREDLRLLQAGPDFLLALTCSQLHRAMDELRALNPDHSA